MTVKTDMVGIKIKSSVTRQEGIDMCVKLKLIEKLDHGDETYTRFTRKGLDVLATLAGLMRMRVDNDPKDILKGS